MASFFGITLVWVLVCNAGLTADARGRENWPRTERPDRERTPFNIEVTNLLGAKGAVTLRVFPGEQKDLDELGGDTRPAKICVAEGATKSCYVARAGETNFARGPQASIVNLGEGQVTILFQTDYLRINDEWRLVTILGVDSHGRLVNLLPELVISMQDNFRIWRDEQLSNGELITAAQYLWTSKQETHFAFHHYRVVTYEFCPRSGRYLLVDEFRTRRKFAGLDDEDHPGDKVLNAVMPQVKKRLLQQRDASKQSCTK